MTMSALLSRFRRDCRGVAAVEFAVLVPVMLVLFFGTIELSNAVAVDRKVTLTARTLSDLVSQGTSVSTTDIGNFFTAGNAIMTPYPTAPMTMRISAVNIDNNGIATIAWSKGSNIAARAVNSTVTVPDGLKIKGTQLIWSEVSYTYTSIVPYVITGGVTLQEQCYTRPRQSSDVQFTS